MSDHKLDQIAHDEELAQKFVDNHDMSDFERLIVADKMTNDRNFAELVRLHHEINESIREKEDIEKFTNTIRTIINKNKNKNGKKRCKILRVITFINFRKRKKES